MITIKIADKNALEVVYAFRDYIDRIDGLRDNKKRSLEIDETIAELNRIAKELGYTPFGNRLKGT